MQTLKATVDASALPEKRLRELLSMIINATDDTARNEALFDMVYRVEVARDHITIWTLLDTDPNGDIDLTQEGVTITSGDGFGVPRVTNPNFLPIGEGFGFVVFFNRDSKNKMWRG